MIKIKAYLSHRRENGGLSAFAQSLLDWAKKEDITLKVDCKDAKLSRPINEFIGELEASSSVIFLLNDQFFKSPWCMGELHIFLSRRRAGFYGFFISCDDWLPELDIREFFDDFQKSLLRHWNQVADEAKTDKIKVEATLFCDAIPEIIGILQRLYLADEKTMRKSCGEEIWQKFREQCDRIKTDYTPCSANSFEDECKLRMIDRFENSDLLRRKLADQLSIRANRDEEIPIIIGKFWQQNLRSRLSTFYRCAKEALRVSEAEARKNIKDDVRDVLAVLLLGFLNLDSRDRVLNPRLGMFDADSLDFLEDEKEVAELCFSSSVPSFCSRFIYNGAHSRFEVTPERYFRGDNVERTLSFSCDSTVDAELRLIWNLTFPKDKKGEQEYFNRDEMNRLSNGLRRNFERGTARYYLIPSGKPEHPMNQKGVIGALKFQLPYLFTLRTGIKTCPALITADFSTSEIVDELESFAELF